MRLPMMKGFSFGLMSGIITTLGLIVGLHSSTHSTLAVISGILVIAISDALSDALGIHLSEESEGEHTEREVWESTAATFLSKFIFASTFITPVLLLPLSIATAVSVMWGLSLIAIFSYHISRQRGVKPHKAVAEHLAIAIFVILVAHGVGDLLADLG
ncbi:MAG: hypothetical protein QXW19_02275 [Candidatus Bathyarchaeia archaeon]